MIPWTASEARIFRRRKVTTVTTWAEEHVKLPAGVTSVPGYFRAEFTPYLRGVCDTWARPFIRRTVFCAGPQTGKTLSAYLPLFYAMERQPGPALIVMSSQDGARKVMKDYLIPIIRESPTLGKLLSLDPDDTASFRISMPGGMRLYAAWATSASQLKTFPARYGIGDEVDDWPLSTGVSGDPEGLFDVRLRTFPFTSKLTLVSSPGGESGVWSKLLGCQEVRVYLAVCPKCHREQRLVWPQIRWFPEKERDPAVIEGEKLAVYLCAHCEARWNDSERDQAVVAGRWVAVDPASLDPDHLDDPTPIDPQRQSTRPLSVGFHLPAWYSRMVSLSKCAADFLRAGKRQDPVERREALRAWTNNYPAKPWIEARESAIDVSVFDALRDDRPAGTVPPWALVLILTADVQASGCFYELRAWDTSRRSALVRYGFVAAEISGGFDWERYPPGFPRSGDFAALREIYLADYLETDGTHHRPIFGVVDSRYRGVEVTDFCRSMNHDPECAGRPIWPSLGYEQLRGGQLVRLQKVDTYPGTSKLIPSGLWRIDTDTTKLKDALHLRLGVTPGDPGSWLLHRDTGADYVQHYRAESKDELTQRWVQRGRQPNHWLDCGVLQLAAANVLETQGLFGRLSAPRPAAERQQAQRPQERQRLW